MAIYRRPVPVTFHPFTSISRGLHTAERPPPCGSVAPRLARSSRTPSGEEAFSAADDHGADNHLEFVDKTRPYRLRGEFRTVNSDVVLSVGLEPPDCVGIERSILVRALRGSARVLE
jgi:hypothetical protein